MPLIRLSRSDEKYFNGICLGATSGDRLGEGNTACYWWEKGTLFFPEASQACSPNSAVIFRSFRDRAGPSSNNPPNTAAEEEGKS